jgi:rod shape-determining protein MreD
MTNLLKNIIRFLVFIAIQVFILNQIPPLHRFISPYLYFLFLLWLPFRLPRMGLTMVAFLFGLTLDVFTKSPGLHAFSCTLIAYVRPFLINLLMPKDGAELSYSEPSATSMGLIPYSTYVVLLTFLHHLSMIFLEWLQLGNAWYFFGKVLATTGISLLLVAVSEMIFNRKSRYRTNVV